MRASQISAKHQNLSSREHSPRQAEIHSVAAKHPNCRTAQNAETKCKYPDLQAQSITTAQMHLKYHMQPASH